MPTKPVKKSDKRHDKHTEVTAASFRRLARALRAFGKQSSMAWPHPIARIFDAEAKLLRSMR